MIVYIYERVSWWFHTQKHLSLNPSTWVQDQKHSEARELTHTECPLTFTQGTCGWLCTCVCMCIMHACSHRHTHERKRQQINANFFSKEREENKIMNNIFAYGNLHSVFLNWARIGIFQRDAPNVIIKNDSPAYKTDPMEQQGEKEWFSLYLFYTF